MCRIMLWLLLLQALTGLQFVAKSPSPMSTGLTFIMLVHSIKKEGQAFFIAPPP